MTERPTYPRSTLTCIVPACFRKLEDNGSTARMCGRCWRLVSPEVRLALDDHETLTRFPWLVGDGHIDRYQEIVPFLDWSRAITFALAAWEAATERQLRRSATYEAFSEEHPPTPYQIGHTMNRLGHEATLKAAGL